MREYIKKTNGSAVVNIKSSEFVRKLQNDKDKAERERIKLKVA